MSTKIEIEWPRDNNLPESEGWYLIESPTFGTCGFVYVRSDEDGHMEVWHAGSSCAYCQPVSEYQTFKWSDKIDL